jgi:hypothetical protein
MCINITMFTCTPLPAWGRAGVGDRRFIASKEEEEEEEGGEATKEANMASCVAGIDSMWP